MKLFQPKNFAARNFYLDQDALTVYAEDFPSKDTIPSCFKEVKKGVFVTEVPKSGEAQKKFLEMAKNLPNGKAILKDYNNMISETAPRISY